VTRLSTEYRRLWWAAAVDNVGDGAFAAAVALLAVTITRDPRLISVVSAATYLPWLVLSLPAGALVDRYDRAALMWRAQALQAGLVAVVAVLAAFGTITIPVLAVLAFGLGAGEVVFGNAAQAILPDLVPKPLLHKANAAQYTVTTIGQLFLGPPVGSLLFAVSVALPFGLDAGTFALSAALLATLPRRARPSGQLPIRTAIADGLRYLTRHRLLRTLALLLGVNNFCFQLGGVTLVLLATRTLHLDARGYGLLLAGGAVGSVVGGLVNARIIARTGALPALLAALAANVLLFVGIGLAPDPAVLAVLLAGNGFVTGLWNIVTVSLRQQIVPSELLGRVNSVYRMLGWGLIPPGALTGGLVAHALGVRAGYPVAGAIRALALLVALPVLVRELSAERGPGGRRGRPR
jgi:MFS family permease